jgi:hypothetical protein
MRLPRKFGINHTLAFAILLEKHLGIPFVLQGEGLEAYPVPWYWMIIELNADEIVWLMNQCAEVGARADLMFLNGVLEQMLP